MAPIVDVLEISVIWPIKEYIHRWQATVTDHLACRTIYELCMGVENMLGYSQLIRWWEQDGGREVE